MGIEQNAFIAYSDGMTEESCFTQCHNNNAISMCRLICCKKKYVAFFTGNMDAATAMINLYHNNYAVGSVGELKELNQNNVESQA